MSGPLDIAALPAEQRCSYYELLFAMAAADGGFTPEELEAIHLSLDLRGFSAAQRDRMRSAIVRPPRFAAVLERLASASSELRHGVLVGLYDAALADGGLRVEEERAIEQAADVLGIARDRLPALGDFLIGVRAVRDAGEPDEDDLDRLKSAAETFAAAGLPVASAYFAASVQELGAAGHGAALETLGLGLGMVPGMGVAIYIGSTVRVSVSDLLTLTPSRITHPEPDAAAISRSREALVHLQQLANRTAEDLERQASPRRDPDGESPEVLRERLDGLVQLLRTRRSALEDMG